ncbi:MAG: heme-binding protein [Pseudomonadota bacterium]
MKHLPVISGLVSAVLAVSPGTAFSADTATHSELTLEGAHRAVAAAFAYARGHAAPGGAVAVVDAGGHTILVERLDGTFPAGADISMGKARTAVMFRRPTRGIEETINKGRDAMIPLAAITWFTPLQGGIPITVNGEIVGGIGVSGASSAQQDEEIAIAGAQALATPAVTKVELRKAADVKAAFAQGETGATLVDGGAFRVAASRRDGVGQAELHAIDTDIFYVLEGHATVIVGGEIVDGKETAPNEIRGARIKGGEEREISAGDVLTIPRGTPHWFRSVKTPFRYYVVKSVSGT